MDMKLNLLPYITSTTNDRRILSAFFQSNIRFHLGETSQWMLRRMYSQSTPPFESGQIPRRTLFIFYHFSYTWKRVCNSGGFSRTPTWIDKILAEFELGGSLMKDNLRGRREEHRFKKPFTYLSGVSIVECADKYLARSSTDFMVSTYIICTHSKLWSANKVVLSFIWISPLGIWIRMPNKLLMCNWNSLEDLLLMRSVKGFGNDYFT